MTAIAILKKLYFLILDKGQKEPEICFRVTVTFVSVEPRLTVIHTYMYLPTCTCEIISYVGHRMVCFWKFLSLPKLKHVFSEVLIHQ